MIKLDTDASTRCALWVLKLCVAAGFAKGAYYIKTAIDSGKSAHGIVIDAMPMFLFDTFTLLILLKIYAKLRAPGK